MGGVVGRGRGGEEVTAELADVDHACCGGGVEVLGEAGGGEFADGD